MENKKKEICHVCKKEKKPYIVFMDDSILSWLLHQQAREDGEICQRCDQYHAMTGEFKEATESEFELAKKSCEFARNMLKWWEKDEKLDADGDNSREWGGLDGIKKWYRKEFAKSQRNEKGGRKMKEEEHQKRLNKVLKNKKLGEIFNKYCFIISQKERGTYTKLIEEVYELGKQDAKEINKKQEKKNAKKM